MQTRPAPPHPELSVSELRWRLDPETLDFETTADLDPLTEIVGQDRGVAAFRFGMAVDRPGYNVFVTGPAGSGRLDTVEKLLAELSRKDRVPDDLCYVNNFRDPEAPVLLCFAAGRGREFRKALHDMVEKLRREIPQVFESQEYVGRKKELSEVHEGRIREFFKGLDKRVKEMGFALVNVQAGQYQRPELMPLVDGEPVPMLKLEEMAEKGRFPGEELEQLRERYEGLRKEIDQIFLEVRDVQKELAEKSEAVDRMMFTTSVEKLMEPVRREFGSPEVGEFLDRMLEDMAENQQRLRGEGQQMMPGMPFPAPDPFQPYQANLIVDNGEQEGPPVIIEAYPTYRNLFGSIERVVDRTGVWRTDFSRIRAGSFLKANGGYLVLNLMDAVHEPGVWPALKRALKTEKMEIQTFDPYYMFTTSGLKPEPVPVNTKVVVIGDARLHALLTLYDEDVPKIFKVRADFDTSMDNTGRAAHDIARFAAKLGAEESLRPLDRGAVVELLGEAVRMTGRKEKVSSRFPELADLVREADYLAGSDGNGTIGAEHVAGAVRERIYRVNLIEDKMQEMIDRGSLMIDVEGSVTGQVNGLTVIGTGDHVFGRPARITASTAIGREGVINIERESRMSGPIHNKGVFILSGYLRRRFAQDKPLSMAASLAFEQSYSGVEGDSASSTEVYALISSLSGLPLRQDLAVTGSVNQKGEIQPIGGVNEKIEGFFETCRSRGLTGTQGVIVPAANVADLMLREEVVRAVERGEFHIHAVTTVEQGLEILSGVACGERDEQGGWPEGTVFGLADARLRELSEAMRVWGRSEGREPNRKPSEAEPEAEPES